MIDSISSSYVNSSYNSTSSSSSLSYSQQEVVSSVLSNYDSTSLSVDDAKQIVSSFQDAGIDPSKDLSSLMEDYGFNAQEIGSLAGPSSSNGMPPPPPPPPKDEEDSVNELLSSLFEDEEEDSSIFSSSEDESSSSFEEILNYTSRILNLKEDSKDDLLSLLDNFKENSSSYEKDEFNALVKNSLNNILSNEDNYKSVSFYA